jgi:cytochrome c-type biogenesis protein CcmH
VPEWGVLMCFILLGVLATGIACYPLKQSPRMLWMMTSVCGLVLALGYVAWGGFSAWHAFQQEEQKQREAEQVVRSFGSIDVLIERMKARVATTPKDAKAWFLLGRVYGSEGDWVHAHEALTLAHTLAPQTEEFTLHYAQSVWETHHQAFDDETRVLLVAVLKEHPNQPDALAMLAFDAYNRQLYQDAVMYWEHLLRLTPSTSEDADKLRQAIAKARMH